MKWVQFRNLSMHVYEKHDVLKNLVNIYRQELENSIKINGEQCLKTMVTSKPFPAGCCLNVSKILIKFLESKFKDSTVILVEGSNLEGKNHHFWIKFENDTYIDITADQFNTFGKTFSPVIVERIEKSDFHLNYSTPYEHEEFKISKTHPLFEFVVALAKRVELKINTCPTC